VTDNIYEILFETLGMGLFRCDTRGNALDASRTALELLGLSGSRPPGKPNLFRTGALSHGGTAAAALKAIAEGSPYSRELSRRSSPGDHIYLRVHIVRPEMHMARSRGHMGSSRTSPTKSGSRRWPYGLKGSRSWGKWPQAQPTP